MSTTQLFTASNNPPISLSAAIPPPTPRLKHPIELHQAWTRMKCGATALRVDIVVANSAHRYAIGVYPGFEGGGREDDMTLAPRVRHSESTPKLTNAATGKVQDAFPPAAAVERRIDGQLIRSTAFPEGSVPQRLERAFMKVEPLLRQLVNQRQMQLESGGVVGVADQPLIARIKTILTDF